MIKFVQLRIRIWSIIRLPKRKKTLPKRKKTLAQRFHRFLIRVMEWRIRRLHAELEEVRREIAAETVPDIIQVHEWYALDLRTRMIDAKKKLKEAQDQYVDWYIWKREKKE